MPSWAIVLAPIDELQSGANEEEPEKPRLWMAMGVALVAPRRTPMGLRCGLAISDGKQLGRRRVYDADSDEFCDIIVPDGINSGAYVEATWQEVVEAEVEEE